MSSVHVKYRLFYLAPESLASDKFTLAIAMGSVSETSMQRRTLICRNVSKESHPIQERIIGSTSIRGCCWEPRNGMVFSHHLARRAAHAPEACSWRHGSSRGCHVTASRLYGKTRSYRSNMMMRARCIALESLHPMPGEEKLAFSKAMRGACGSLEDLHRDSHGRKANHQQQTSMLLTPEKEQFQTLLLASSSAEHLTMQPQRMIVRRRRKKERENREEEWGRRRRGRERQHHIGSRQPLIHFQIKKNRAG